VPTRQVSAGQKRDESGVSNFIDEHEPAGIVEAEFELWCRRMMMPRARASRMPGRRSPARRADCLGRLGTIEAERPHRRKYSDRAA